MIELHASDNELAAARSAVAQAGALGARSAALAALAWHLRERAPAEALETAGQALAGPCDAATRARALATEAYALCQTDAAEAAAHSLQLAREAAAGAADPITIGDTEFVAAQIHVLDGDGANAALAFERARSAYAAAPAPARALVLEAVDALATVPRATRSRRPSPSSRGAGRASATRASASSRAMCCASAARGHLHGVADLPRPPGQSSNEARIESLQTALAIRAEAGVEYDSLDVCFDLSRARSSTTLTIGAAPTGRWPCRCEASCNARAAMPATTPTWLRCSKRSATSAAT